MSKAEKMLDKSKASIKEGLEASYQVIQAAVRRPQLFALN